MAGLNNSANPFPLQQRNGPQYVQLVPGPPGPSGSGALSLESNGSVLPAEPIVNFIGLGAVDNPGATRIDVTGFDLVQTGVDANVAVTTVNQDVLVFFSGLTAARSCTLPGSPATGQRVAVVVDGSCTAVKTISMPPALVFKNPNEFAIVEWTGTVWVVISRSQLPLAPSAISDPGAVITGNTSVGALQTWVVIDSSGGGFTLTYAACLPGVIYRISDRGGALAGANQVIVSCGAAAYSIEDPSPPFALNPRATSPPSASLVVPYQTYELCLDPTGNRLRCIS